MVECGQIQEIFAVKDLEPAARVARAVPEKRDGVIDTKVGYTGGTVKDATYDDVKKGSSGHAESVQIVFDPDRISYEELLGYFFRMHDPTTLDRQGNDRGTQYRSVIFAISEEQEIWAAKAIEDAVIKITREKIKSLAAGKMGYSTSQVGDLVAAAI